MLFRSDDLLLIPSMTDVTKLQVDDGEVLIGYGSEISYRNFKGIFKWMISI